MAKKRAKRMKMDAERRLMGAYTYILMEERNESEKMNGEWQETKEQQKTARTRAKGKKMKIKGLVEAKDRRKNGRTQALLQKMSEKTNQYKVGEV